MTERRTVGSHFTCGSCSQPIRAVKPRTSRVCTARVAPHVGRPNQRRDRPYAIDFAPSKVVSRRFAAWSAGRTPGDPMQPAIIVSPPAKIASPKCRSGRRATPNRGCTRRTGASSMSGAEDPGQIGPRSRPVASIPNRPRAVPWCRRRGSNPRPSVYKTAALPLCYAGAGLPLAWGRGGGQGADDTRFDPISRGSSPPARGYAPACLRPTT